jgi:hypothetical protein
VHNNVKKERRPYDSVQEDKKKNQGRGGEAQHSPKSFYINKKKISISMCNVAIISRDNSLDLEGIELINF